MGTVTVMQNHDTSLVHGPHEIDPVTGAVVPAIQLASTFTQDAPGEHRGYEYARTGNPTRSAFESHMAAVESGLDAVAFASGLAAIDAVIRTTCSAGSRIALGADPYGGSFRLVRDWGRFGVGFDVVDLQRHLDAGDLASRLEGFDLVLFEAVTNPLLRVVDVAGVCAAASNAVVCVDATFSSPAALRPLELGAHLSLHSATKYIGGHSDLVGGVVSTADRELAARLHWVQNAAGAVLSPHDCYLADRGLKTLSLRLRQASANAEELVRRLAGDSRVTAVHHPYWGEHAQRARRMLKMGGGMVSIELHDPDAARRVASGFSLFRLAESLGAVESLVCLPGAMTHASLPAQHAISPALLRLSVGIEDVEDLWADLDTALSAGAR